MSERTPVKRVNKEQVEPTEFKASASFAEPTQEQYEIETKEALARAIKAYQRADGVAEALRNISTGKLPAPVIEFTARTSHSDQPVRLAIDTALLSKEDLSSLMAILLKTTHIAYENAVGVLAITSRNLSMVVLDETA